MLIYLIRPRASLSCRLERWPLGIYFTEVVAEFFGEAFDDFRVTGAKVVLFADIVGDVEQFFLAGTVIVNQFPVAIRTAQLKLMPGPSLPQLFGIFQKRERPLEGSPVPVSRGTKLMPSIGCTVS